MRNTGDLIYIVKRIVMNAENLTGGLHVSLYILQLYNLDYSKEVKSKIMHYFDEL